MRGQYLTVEYMLFFAIGIIMIIAVYFSFSNLNDVYSDYIVKNQLQMTGELITGAIINLYEASNYTNSTINYSLTIPTKLSKCIYSINIVQKRLNLNCTDTPKIGAVTPLYNFNITNKNIIYSTNGLIKIFVKEGVVELT